MTKDEGMRKSKDPAKYMSFALPSLFFILTIGVNLRDSRR